MPRSNCIKFKPPEILELLGRLKPYCFEPVGFFAFDGLHRSHLLRMGTKLLRDI